MSYVSLYRKWRPKTFAEVIGQDHIISTLVNALRTDQVHHALLFAGTRGTGKTTTARILAKSLNCEHGPTPEPCGQCTSCRTITDGTSLDVTEIDAASHGSVDDARDLREKATYAPASSRFKIYIIDEAHMVTTQGFNAMLKVLEEPPEHVRFIFATTEPRKVIEAIRSRCQQHDFRRVRASLLVEHFASICAAEGVQIEPAALELVARAADGSVRDGLSRLDQVLIHAGKQVTLDAVAAVLGALPTELRFELGDALAGHQAGAVFTLVERVTDGGHDLTQFAREALEHARDLYVLRVAPDSTTLVDAPPETRARLAAQAERFGPGELGRIVRLLGELLLDLRTATDPRLVLEVGLARAALPDTAQDSGALLARIERLEQTIAQLSSGGTLPPAAPAPPPPPSSANAGAPAAAPASDRPTRASTRPAAASTATRQRERPTTPAPTTPAPTTPAPSAPAASTSTASTPAAQGGGGDGWAATPAAAGGPADLEQIRRAWPGVLERVRAASRVTATFLEHGRPADLDGRRLQIHFPTDSRFHAESLKDDRIRQIEGVLTQLLGSDLTIAVTVTDTPPAADAGAGAGTGAAAPTGPPRPAAADPAPPAPPFESPEPDDHGFTIDPDDGPGQALGSDADTRAVADLAAREFGGEVIEERPND